MGEELKAAWLAARSAWPGVHVGEDEFAAYLRERTDSAKGTAEHAPADLRTEDLYLACACARGDNAALAAFERAFFGEVDMALTRSGGSAAPPADEVRQLVRHKLFVAEPGKAPKIADYAGRGALRSWFRVTVTRLVLNLSTRPSPEVPIQDHTLMFLLGGGEDPDLERVKHTYKEEFRASFAEAFASLTVQERAMLRYAFGEGLTVDAIGALYGIHRATAARWVVRAHETLLERVRTALVARLGISEDEYSRVLLLVQSRLELSLERYLKPTPP
jgi:RNA polymerase sigma-70 factor (ECF subfamily)